MPRMQRGQMQRNPRHAAVCSAAMLMKRAKGWQMQHQLLHRLETAMPSELMTLANLGALESGLAIKSHVTTCMTVS